MTTIAESCAYHQKLHPYSSRFHLPIKKTSNIFSYVCPVSTKSTNETLSFSQFLTPSFRQFRLRNLPAFPVSTGWVTARPWYLSRARLRRWPPRASTLVPVALAMDEYSSSSSWLPEKPWENMGKYYGKIWGKYREHIGTYMWWMVNVCGNTLWSTYIFHDHFMGRSTRNGHVQ